MAKVYVSRVAKYAGHEGDAAWVGIVRIAAAEWRVLLKKNVNRQGGRMARYVPEGIVGQIIGGYNCT